MDWIPDEQILPLSREHVFWTWSAQAEVDPIAVKKAQGVYFWDTEGRRYLDFNSMTMCVNAGHGNRRIIAAIQEQLESLPYAAPGMATSVRAAAAQKIASLTPQGALKKVLFTLGGADANENAVKLARAYTGRHKILTRYRSYHGATAGAMALSGDPRRWMWEPNLMPGVVHFFGPYAYRSPLHRGRAQVSEAELTADYLAHLEEIIQYEGPQTIAAILLETVTGTNGILIPPAGYLAGVRALCDQYGILMIMDEVMSGFGRTGKWFAVQHWDVTPDIITMAKGLTSAYAPLGAVAMKPEIAARFDHETYQGGLTYTAHPVSLAAALANIRVMEEEGLVARAAALDGTLKRLLAEMAEKHPSVGDVRSMGLFGILELVKDRQTREPLSPWNTTNAPMKALRAFCRAQGLFLYTHWHTVLIIPPLVITEAQLEEGFAILDQALALTDQAAA